MKKCYDCNELTDKYPSKDDIICCDCLMFTGYSPNLHKYCDKCRNNRTGNLFCQTCFNKHSFDPRIHKYCSKHKDSDKVIDFCQECFNIYRDKIYFK